MIKLINQLLLAIALTLASLLVSAAQPIDINTATVHELQALHGIGAKKAEAIVKYREEHGAFQSVDELTKVPGIGKKTVDDIKANLTAGAAGAAGGTEKKTMEKPTMEKPEHKAPPAAKQP